MLFEKVDWIHSRRQSVPGLSHSAKDSQIRIVLNNLSTLLFISRLPWSLKCICVNQNIGVMYCTLSDIKICNSTQKWRHASHPFHNTAAKRLRMRQVEHFRSLFQSHFPVKVARALHSVCSLWFSCSALCCSCFWLFCSYWNCFYG